VASLVSTFPQAEAFDVLRSSKWKLSSWRFSFCGRRFFSEVSHPQQYSIATRDTVVPLNTEVPTKYQLSHDDRIFVLEIRLHSESPMLYRPALHGNWNSLSLARRALKDKFPTPTVPLTALLPNRQVFLPDPVYNSFNTIIIIVVLTELSINTQVHRQLGAWRCKVMHLHHLGVLTFNNFLHHTWNKTGNVLNIEARSSNHCCCGKAISITYSELCVCSLSYPTCKAHAPYYIVISGLADLTIFFRIVSQTVGLSGKKK